MTTLEKGFARNHQIFTEWRRKDIPLPELCDFSKVALAQVRQKNYKHSIVSCSARRRTWLYISLPRPAVSYDSKEWNINLGSYIVKEALKVATCTLHNSIISPEEERGLYAENSCEDSVEKIKPNAAAVMAGLIIELLLSKDNALWKTRKGKGLKPRQQNNDNTKSSLRKYDALRDHKKKPWLRTLFSKICVIFYKLKILHFFFCFQFSHIKLFTYNTL